MSYFGVATIQKHFILTATNVQGWICTSCLYSVWNIANYLLITSHSCCKFVGYTSMMQNSSSTITQRGS